MVIGLFIITAIPTVTGVCQAVSAQRNREQREKDENRMKKFNIDVCCTDEANLGSVAEHGRLVLRDGRVWIGPPKVLEQGDYGYVAESFYIEYPDSERIPVPLGLVSQVSKSPPLLNWIYIDKNTLEIRYGNKSVSIEHHVGTWDWTKDEEYITFEELKGGQGESFVAVQNHKDKSWQLFYDLSKDGLSGHVPQSSAQLKVRLKRSLLGAA